MKSFKILASALAIAAAVLTGCTKDLVQSGIDTSKPGVTDITYGTFQHASNSITISWEAGEAIAAGATSFSVQLVDDLDGNGVDMYDNSIGLSIKTEEGKTKYEATLSGQKVGDKYFVRVRANYRRSVFSPWTWVKDKDGNALIYKVGRGFIPQGTETPYLYKVTPTSTGLIVKWDIIPGMTSYVIEYKKSSDAQWTSVECGADASNVKIKNLPSNTSYDVRAKALGDKVESAYCEVVTVSTRQPGSYPKEMKTADEFIAWLEGGIVEVETADTYSITADLDLAGQQFTAMDEPLMGTFDGKGHTVKGVASTMFYNNEGTIKDLKVECKDLAASDGFGAFITTNAASGTIKNVSVKANVTCTVDDEKGTKIGGFTYNNAGTIDGCTFDGSLKLTGKAVTSAVVAGGIACFSNGTIKNSVNKASVDFKATTLKGFGIAGIVGYLEGALDNCTNDGGISASAEYANGKATVFNTSSGTPAVAGICAYGNTDNFGIKGCTNNGAVSYTLTAIEKYTTSLNRNQFAGIVANPYGLVENCINNGPISITQKTSTGDQFTSAEHIACTGGIGGGDVFAGSGQDKTSYINCTNNGSIDIYTDVFKSNSTCGGICGWPGAEAARDNKTSGCKNYGNITINGTGKTRTGGIHGGTGNIENCENYGTVEIMSAAPETPIGGIAGFHSQAHYIKGCLSECVVRSNVSTTQGVGGLVGNQGNAASKISNNRVRCKVVNNGSATAAASLTTGMVVGYWNGNSSSTSYTDVKVTGAMVIDGKTTLINAGNLEANAQGTKNMGGSHTFKVSFDATPWTDPEGGDTPEPEKKLSAPTNIAVQVMYNTVTITWDAVENAEWYVVEYKAKTAEEWTASDRVTDTKCVLEGLAHGTEYNFRVKAFASYSSDFSETVVEQTLEEVVLGTPVVTLTAEATTIEATWAAITKATGYAVEYKLSSAETWTSLGTVTDTKANISGLSQMTAYDVRVKALGEGGNEGSFCDPVSITTPKVEIKYPYTVSNAKDFATWLAVATTCTETDEVILGADIDMSGVAVETAASFAGILNGNGKALKNMTVPVFQTLTGTVKNLTLNGKVSLSLKADETGAGHPLAALAIISKGTVTGCTNKGTVTMTSTGIIGSPVVAGLVAYQEGGTFKDNSNTGAVTLTHAGSANVKPAGFNRSPFCVAAGVIGLIINGTVENCTNEGAVTVTCTNNAKVGARHYIGGVLGTPENSVVKGCTNKGAVKGLFDEKATTAISSGKQVWVGGVIGGRNGDVKTVDGALVENCNNYGEITLQVDNNVNSYLAGVAGQALCEATGTSYTSASSTFQKIVNSNNYGKLIKKGVGGARVGGIAAGAATIDNCTNEGEIVIEGMMEGKAVGGIVGYPTQAYHPVTNCKSLGKITSTAKTVFAIGGIGGQGGNTAQNYSGCVINCEISAQAENECGMILGTAKTLTKTITCGTAEAPIKVKGKINGTTLSSENFASYLASDGSPVDGVITTAASGSINVANVVYGD